MPQRPPCSLSTLKSRTTRPSVRRVTNGAMMAGTHSSAARHGFATPRKGRNGLEPNAGSRLERAMLSERIRRGSIVGLLSAAVLALAACHENNGEMLETARFEEMQHNYQHARDLYQRVLQNNPSELEAQRANQR